MTHARDGRERGVVVASVLVALALAVMNWLLVHALTTRPLWDLTVYREAIRFWDSGGELYDYRLEHPSREEGFPFTYPPFAALALRPLTLLPDALVNNAWTIGTLALVTGMAAFVIAPRESVTYWGSTLLETSRVGEVATVQNTSLLGMMSRWDIGGAAHSAVWIALSPIP